MKDRFGLSFAPGLEESLEEHIQDQHGPEIKKHNAGLAITIAEHAMNERATRLMRESDTDKGSVREASSDKIILPVDFGIDKETPEEVQARKDAVEKEIELLIGMEAGKK